MFVRQKRNKSGSVSVQVIDKSNGFRVVHSLGSSKDADEIQHLLDRAHHLIHTDPPGQFSFFNLKSPEDLAVESFMDQLTNAHIRTVGPEIIFGSLFDRMGFSQIRDKLFRHLVIARLVYPTSKLKTIDYLKRYQGKVVSVDTIYRFMDKLHHRYQDKIEAIAYEHTRKRLGSIHCVFYDMTSLYFEAEDEDDLRKVGFSKDGKFQHPQILLGLLVGTGGLPIGYDLFEGNTFEGHTLLPVLRKIQSRYHFGKPVVVADAALLSTSNIRLLSEEGYRFILGGRIKNEAEVLKEDILRRSAGMKDGDSFALEKNDGTQLVVTYSRKRAGKDASNRVRGVQKLREQIKSGRLSKQSINNRGYNRFLTIEGRAVIRLDEEKIRQDALWDGLKGYITNAELPPREVVENYVQLWQIEKAFRISKTDLRVRPIYHYRKRRIEAHISIAFVAYSIYKELERVLRRHGKSISPQRAAELTHTMYELQYELPISRHIKRKLLKMDPEQQSLYDALLKP